MSIIHSKQNISKKRDFGTCTFNDCLKALALLVPLLLLFHSSPSLHAKTSDNLDGPNPSSYISDMRKVYKNNFSDDFVGQVQYPEWFYQSDFMNYQEDLNEALAEGKDGVFFLFTTQGCPYCDKFIDLSLGDPKIANMLQKHFVPTGIEIFNDIEVTDFNGTVKSAKDFAKSEGVQFTPTLVFYGKDGKKLFQAVGYQSPERFKHILEYVSAKHYQSQSIREYIKQHAKNNFEPSLADTLIDSLYQKTVADRIFDQNPTKLNRRSNGPHRPLMVLFEEQDCQDCVDFHENILPVKQVRDLLEHFQLINLDANDNKSKLVRPNNTETTPAQWLKELDIQKLPALVFFDSIGRQVLKTDAIIRQKRMIYSCEYVLEGAFDKGWSYQRFGRAQEIKKRLATSQK